VLTHKKRRTRKPEWRCQDVPCAFHVVFGSFFLGVKRWNKSFDTISWRNFEKMSSFASLVTARIDTDLLLYWYHYTGMWFIVRKVSSAHSHIYIIIVTSFIACLDSPFNTASQPTSDPRHRHLTVKDKVRRSCQNECSCRSNHLLMHQKTVMWNAKREGCYLSFA
jgi:hypothetical protein